MQNKKNITKKRAKLLKKHTHRHNQMHDQFDQTISECLPQIGAQPQRVS